MKSSTRFFRLPLLLLTWCGVGLAQTVSAVYVEVPKPRLIAGEQVQLQAAGLDATGAPVKSATFAWATNNANVAVVDSNGMVTSKGLGIADITATAPNRASGVARIQVLPQRIVVLPGTVNLHIGDSRQYSATAYDANGAAMAGITFQWAVTALDGGNTVSASIDKNGLLYAYATGAFQVRAAIAYNGYVGEYVTQVFGMAQLGIDPKLDYTSTRLVSSADQRTGLHLRTRRGSFAANATGTVAFSGNLDGITNGLMLHDGNRLSVLISGGQPGPVPSGPMLDFTDPAINLKGTVLTRADAYGAGSSLFLCDQQGVRPVVVDGHSLGAGVTRSNNFQTTRYSLNDNDEFVYRANFVPDPTAPGTFVVGFFRYSASGVSLEVTSTDPLPGLDGPGLNGPASLGSEFGLDNNGQIYFLASKGTVAGLFRKDPLAGPVLILKTGDLLAGSTVSSLSQVGVQPAGDLVVTGRLASNAQFIARYLPGNFKTPAITTTLPGFTLFSFQSNEALLRLDPGTGYGLYRFFDALQPVLLRGALAPNGEPINDFTAGVVLGTGEVIANVTTPGNPMLYIRMGRSGSTLFTGGSPVDSVASLNPRSIIPGDRTTGLDITMGGQYQSVIGAEDAGLNPRMVIGDQLPPGAIYVGQYATVKSPSGDLYVTTDSSLHRIREGVPTLISAFPIVDGTLTYFAPTVASANDDGQLAVASFANPAGSALAILHAGRMQTMAISGVTDIAGFGTWTGRGDMAIDATGRVLVHLNLSNGGSGYFLYAAGGWKPALILRTTEVGGAVVTSFGSLRVSGGTFYAMLSLANGTSCIASYDGDQWKPLISRGDAGPNGNTISSFQTFDVNSKGELAIVSSLNGTNALFVLSGSEMRLIHLANIPIDSEGTFVVRYDAVDLRDDGRVYFSIMDNFEYLSFYRADRI